MKLKTAIIIIIVACILGAAHYNDQITISVTLPSPAQVVDTVGKVASEMTKESDKNMIDIEVHDTIQHSASVSKENTDDSGTELYRISKSPNVRLKENISNKGICSSLIKKRYGKSKQLIYVYGFALIPIGYVRHKTPLDKKRSINKYTPEGRIEIHKNLEAISLKKSKTVKKGARKQATSK